MDVLRILWGLLSRLSSEATRDGFVYSKDPPASPHKCGWGGTLATARLEIKAHVWAVLGGFWDQMIFDLPLQKLRVLMHRAHQEPAG